VSDRSMELGATGQEHVQGASAELPWQRQESRHSFHY